MTEHEGRIVCTRCGSVAVATQLYVACVLQTRWLKVEKTAGMDSAYGHTIRVDDVKPWLIGLCDQCIPPAIRSYWETELEAARGSRQGALVIFAAGVVSTLLFQFLGDPRGLIHAIAYLASPILAVGGAVAAIIHSAKIHRLSKSLERDEVLEEIGEEPRAAACRGEAARVWNVLEGGGGAGEVFGDFVLPVRRASKVAVDGTEIAADEAEARVDASQPVIRDTSIVAETLDELDAQLKAAFGSWSVIGSSDVES